MQYLGYVIRIGFARKAQMAGEIAHRLIGACIQRVHGLDATLARNFDQVLHEQSRKSLVVPLVADGYRAFATQSVAARAVAADADFTLACAVGDQATNATSLA